MFAQWDVSEQPKHSACVLLRAWQRGKLTEGLDRLRTSAVARGACNKLSVTLLGLVRPATFLSGGRMNADASFRCAPTGPDPLWRYLTEHDPKYEGKKKLKISGRELAAVPEQVFGLDQLQVLEMSPERESCLTHRLELLPRDISRLKNLTLLYMDSNNLKALPAEIGSLRHLERLTLSNNRLSSLPPEMAALQRLRSLHLANNSLTELPAPLCQLRGLTFLDLSDNKIRTIPSSIRHLEKLETLLLLFNSLESLPEDICVLRNLHTLWLGNNCLRALPASFGELVNLDWGCNYCSCNFEGNPLECPPPEICSRGPEEIRDYFLSLHRTQRE
nr:leucine-rich repeat-containing protein 40 [Anas platyrhynchos]